MKKILLLIFLTSSLFAQSIIERKIIERKIMEKPVSVRGSAISQNGSNQYESVTPALRLTGDIALNISRVVSDSAAACNQVYGQWAFTVNKDGDGDAIDVHIISDLNTIVANNGYKVTYGADEKMYLYSIAAGTPTARITSTGTFAYGSTHSVVVTRNTNGAFNLLVNGTSVGTVTNATYVSSNYTYFDMTASDVVGTVRYEFGEGSLDLNSYGRIKLSDNRDFEVSKGDWTDNGNHSVARNTTYKRTGAASLAVTSSAAGGTATNYTSLPASAFVPLKTDANGIYEKYTLELWARGTGILGSELMPNQVDRDFSGASAWANVDLNAYDETGDLTITATAANQYCTLPVLSAPRTSGVTYRLTFTVANLVSTWTIKSFDGTATIGTVTATGAQSITFVSTTTGGYRIVSNTTTSSGDFDDFSLKAITLPSLTLAIGNQTKTVSSISCVPATYTKLVFNFQATANEIGQPIKMYTNQADVVYVDDVSLTKAWDVLANVWIRSVDNTNRGVIFDNHDISTTTTGYSLTKAITGDNNGVFSRISDGTGVVSLYPSTDYATTITNGSYHLFTVLLNRVANGLLYLDGSQIASSVMTALGKINSTNAFAVGRRTITGSVLYFAGQIGETPIFKFTDISQSNVSATTLVQAYKGGLPNTWRYGINVFNPKFRGTTNSQFFWDYSGAGNSLQGTNSSVADRVFGTYPSK